MHQHTVHDTIRFPWNCDFAEGHLPGDGLALTGERAREAALRCPACTGTSAPTLSGAVIDPDGKPVKNVLVLAHWRPHHPACPGRAHSTLACTDDTGSYSFNIPCAGHTYVSFDEDPSYYRLADFEDDAAYGTEAEYGYSFEPVDCSADITWPTVELRHTGTVTGRIRDADGHPVSGLVVQVVSARHPQDGCSLGFSAKTHTDSGGHFTLHGVKGINMQLLVIDPSSRYAAERYGAPDGEREVPFAFDSSWIAQGVELVVAAEGAPGARVLG